MLLQWLYTLLEKWLIKKEPPPPTDPVLDRLKHVILNLEEDAWLSHAFTTLPTLGDNVADSTQQLKRLRQELSLNMDLTPLEVRYMPLIDYLTYRGTLVHFSTGFTVWLEEAQQVLWALPKDPMPHEEVACDNVRMIIRHHCSCLESVI